MKCKQLRVLYHSDTINSAHRKSNKLKCYKMQQRGEQFYISVDIRKQIGINDWRFHLFFWRHCIYFMKLLSTDDD